ncbi:uncharacterized protein E0L32_011352 [Thyridium curvatum]|uniref:Uncharacterized protein n=1 Tax=Thyridium curvatum TaxID=1093900 RepID=A0A507BN49_9PEZI|nr:uncharacterized protein E0L32_011352 [Thyridium curvatum]TPX18959.1 hypothetical protein E0L32_011352 [Thyridium curvatum]
MHLSKLTAFAALVASVIASPAPAPAPSPDVDTKLLAKRAEGIHLLNCVTYSTVVYCANDSNCNFNPGAGNACSPGSGVFHWEGGSHSCTFGGTGVTFTWAIDSNAQSYPNFQKAGTGSNGFHNFNCFKDDQHVMYTDGNGHACRSIYYCLDQLGLKF